MDAIIDTSPFPFDTPQGQDLLSVLRNTYPRPEAVEELAARTGFDLSKLSLGKPAGTILFEMLQSGSHRRDRVRRLIETVLDEHSDHLRADFLRALLAQGPAQRAETIPVDAGTSRGRGAHFLHGTDEIGRQEALLFHDNLMIETATIPALLATLEGLTRVEGSVCRLRLTYVGGEQDGTGFRIGSDLVLTNWHVLNRDDRPRVRVEAWFDSSGKEGGAELLGDLETIRGDKTHDWAVIRLRGAMPDVASAPILRLDEAEEPVLNEPAYIIQHPGGGPKRLAFVRNQVFFVNAQVVQYLTDTQQGSSGSPVFNARCRLLAIHHMGGAPQEKIGKAPLKKNEGIRISVILNGLARIGVVVA